MSEKLVGLEEMAEILEQCFFVLRNNEHIKNDPGCTAALTLVENCCKDLLRTIVAMGEALGKLEGARDNEGEPFKLHKKSSNESKSN